MNLQKTIRRILKEENIGKSKYIDYVKLIEKFMNMSYPNFNKERVKEKKVMKVKLMGKVIAWNYEFIDSETNKKFATYDEIEKELQLNGEIFVRLRNIFGDVLMEHVIDWFNNEFNKDAEYVTF